MCADSNGAKMNIPWTLRYQFAYEIALGMDHIHSWNVIHRDLKSGNVLITEHYHCYIIDFGISRSNRSNRMTLNLGTTSWMAPEILDGDGRYTPAVDVYSYGMLLWEIAARTRPHQNMITVNITDSVLKGWRPEIPPDCPPTFARLIERSWDHNPQKRPTFAQIAAILKENIGFGTFSTLEKLAIPSMCPIITQGKFSEPLSAGHCRESIIGHQRNYSGNDSSQEKPIESIISESSEDKSERSEQILTSSSDGVELSLPHSLPSSSPLEIESERSLKSSGFLTARPNEDASSLPGVGRVQKYFRDRNFLRASASGSPRE
jgi:serine/threonine protein kinase